MKQLEVDVARLAKSGEGVALVDGRSVFIEGAAPGDRLLVELDETAKVLRGEIRQVLKAGPSRREPSCALHASCGGCQWLHLNEAEQLTQKFEIVLSALEHVGGISRASLQLLPPVVSPRAMGSRRRAVMHPTSGQLGFHGRRSHQRVAVAQCPALSESLASLPAELAQRLKGHLPDIESVELLEADGALSIALQLKVALKPRTRMLAEALVKEGVLNGVVLVPHGGNAPVLVGSPVLRDGDTDVRPDAFAQANLEVNRQLVKQAVELTEGDAVIELFAGNGNFTFSLARKVGRVVAVESSAVSVGLAQSALRRHALTNVRFLQGDATRIVEGVLKEAQRFDAVLLDPPRSGCPGIGGWAQRFGAKSVVYVSCDPTSLARDAAELVQNGFRPLSVQVFDMFPQTAHIETLMLFTRG